MFIVPPGIFIIVVFRSFVKLKVLLFLQWLNFGYMDLTKTETKGAHLVEGVAKVLQMIYIPALTNYMSWGGLPSLQVTQKKKTQHFQENTNYSFSFI